MAGGVRAGWPKGHLKQSPSSAGLDLLAESRPGSGFFWACPRTIQARLATWVVSDVSAHPLGTGRQAQLARQCSPPALCPASLPLPGSVIIAARMVPSPSIYTPGIMLTWATLRPHPMDFGAFLLTFSTVFRLYIDLITSSLK